MATPREIKTFAFLDLETTGLPNLNFGRTSITELCMIACSSTDLKVLDESKEAPRSIHKLTMCFNPAALISPKATEFSGLDNYMLEDQNKFDGNSANVIKGFVKHLPKPVCLVAHNGNRFDFPILRKQLRKAGVELADDVLCVDSLLAFRQLDKIVFEKDPDLKNLDKKNAESEADKAQTSQGIENDDQFQKVLKEEFENIKSEEESVNWQKLNETTPKRPVEQKVKHRKIFNSDDESPTSENRVFKSRRELFPSPDSDSKRVPRRSATSYKLVDVYERLFEKKPKRAHEAEADVLTLLKIASFYSQHFEKYAAENATPFYRVSTSGLR